ncbi:MAG: radical SAM protein [Candidatus Omnitrophota bacterium]
MKQEYIKKIAISNLPRLPLEGSIDLTYRCNNNCRHCWLRIPADSQERKEELTFEEIKRIVNEARNMGCREWSISGGEPMLRSDFSEIFEYITSNFSSYSINTNGTLITPGIAKLLKRKGSKMVALYGASADIHDHITRNPGSFEQAIAGFNYLKEAQANFTVQLIPMNDNYHQFPKMVELAQSLSKHYRVGAAWLYLSACGDKKINQEIIRQRLPAREVVELDKPDLSYEETMQEKSGHQYCNDESSYFFSSCIKSRRDFHIDSYGRMTFCCFLKDPSMRYDLRNGSFQEGWEKFIPLLAKKVKITKEYKDNCGSCNLRSDCLWCPVYGYLEHRRFGAKVDYLCEVARENKRFKDNWRKQHRRYFKIADITIQVESDLPIRENTFHPKFKHFEKELKLFHSDDTEKIEKDIVSIRHHFSLPDIDIKDLGKEVYRKPPWAVYKKGDSWIYLGISPQKENKSLHCVVVFNSGHTQARIYNDKEETFLKGNLHSLTMFPTDQILIARILADRQGCYLHSCGVNFEGKGLLFAGHSEAGKSTMANLLKGKAEILCDDRMIIRDTAQGFKIYGTWSHGDVPDVSGNSAPLRAILFLEKAKGNRIILIKDKKEITKRLLAVLIRPFVTADWWEKTLSLIERISQDVPCYVLRFDKNPEVIYKLKQL